MVKKTSKKKEKSKKAVKNLSNGDKLVCDECGLTLIVDDECACDQCAPVMCCDEEMTVC
ncbi:MAG: hypothetical protein ABSH12_04810 [Endomicrobiales bacterium]|jgi:hypothetical protein